jgi:hypothetical protein
MAYRPFCYAIRDKDVEPMFWIVTVLLFVVWALGLAIDYTGSGLIHVLPLIAIAAVLLRLIEGAPRRSISSGPAKANNSPYLVRNGRKGLNSD